MLFWDLSCFCNDLRMNHQLNYLGLFNYIQNFHSVVAISNNDVSQNNYLVVSAASILNDNVMITVYFEFLCSYIVFHLWHINNIDVIFKATNVMINDMQIKWQNKQWNLYCYSYIHFITNTLPMAVIYEQVEKLFTHNFNLQLTNHFSHHSHRIKCNQIDCYNILHMPRQQNCNSIIL